VPTQESAADIYADPLPKSVVRFHIGHPLGGYYFAAIHRGRLWSTTSVDDSAGYVTRTMSWNALLAKRPIMQVATDWDPVKAGDAQLGVRLPLIRFKAGSRYEVALRHPVEDPGSPLFGYPPQTDLFRTAQNIEIATGWEDLGFPQLVSPPGCGPLAEVDRDEDWEQRERARLCGTVW
jgi:hypothetical protein